jgi:hypothetical protein
MLIFRRSKLYFTASGIVTLCRRPYSAPVESELQSALNRCTAQPLIVSDIPDAVKYNFDLLKMSIVLLETCRGI